MSVSLFSPYRLGTTELPNRIVMAPMTRGRAEERSVPGDLIVEHYGQRASAGLLITEATHISIQGRGWQGAPGIHTREQMQGWQRVTAAVHQRGGHIFLQLWHMGRASHADFHDGEQSVSSSAMALTGEITTPLGRKPYDVPRALTRAELPGVADQYARATRLAREAGFDGVEIHGANGYLIDQFLRDGCNQRTDDYGGSIANRCRFMLDVVQACIDAWDAGHVGIRFSPVSAFNGMSDSDPLALYSYALKELNRYDLAYVHLVDPINEPLPAGLQERISVSLRKIHKGTLIVNGGFDADTANAALSRDEADLIAFGTPYIANPDLLERYRRDAPLNKTNRDTIYTHDATGYNDYPSLE